MTSSHSLAKKGVGLVALMLIVAMLAWACGGDDDDDAPTVSQGPTATDADPGGVQTQEVPSTGGTSEVEASAPGTPIDEGDAVAAITVQVGELQPAVAGTAPSGWETAAADLIGVRLIAQLDSSGPDAWDVDEHPLVYVSAQGPGYGSSAFGGAFISEVQQGPGVAIIDANTHEAVASTQYLVEGLDTYSENHGLSVSADGKWIYTQGNHPDSNVRGNATLNIINARTLKIDKIIETRVHHSKVIYDGFNDRDLVLIEGWGTFFALDPNDDNRVVGAVNPANLNGSGYLAFSDPSGEHLFISVRTGFRESPGGVAVVSLENWRVETRINTLDSSPIWTTFTQDGNWAFVSDGHESKIAKIDISSESPSEWRLVGLASAGTAGPYGLTMNWDDTILFSIGKGEGSHNQGKTVGFTSPALFSEPDQFRGWGTSMGQIVSDCLRQDHAIVHPNPDLNEMWISCNSSFDNVVVDMGTYEVKAVIPQPNGGSSHNGSFVAYTSNWDGELLSDTNGMHGSALETKLEILGTAVAAGR